MKFIYAGWLTNTTGVSTFCETWKLNGYEVFTMDDVTPKSFENNIDNRKEYVKNVLAMYDLGALIIIIMMYMRHAFRLVRSLQKGKKIDRKGVYSNDLFSAYFFSLIFPGYELRTIFHTSGDNLAMYRIHFNLSNSAFTIRILRLMERRVLEKSRSIIFVSENASKTFIAANPRLLKKVHWVHNGKRIDVYGRDPESQFNLPLRLLCIGTLSKRKGQELVVEAVQGYNRTYGASFMVDFLGDGSILEDLKGKVENADLVRFHGNVEKVDSFLSKANAVVLMSKDEGLPYALIESCAFGVPIISTDVGGISEVVSNGFNGHLIDRNSVALQNTLKLLQGNPDLFKEMGKNARKVYEDKFSFESMKSKYELIWESKN